MMSVCGGGGDTSTEYNKGPYVGCLLTLHYIRMAIKVSNDERHEVNTVFGHNHNTHAATSETARTCKRTDKLLLVSASEAAQNDSSLSAI